eukprot:2679640-Pleurochrysis_carterae.AAC.4
MPVVAPFAHSYSRVSSTCSHALEYNPTFPLSCQGSNRSKREPRLDQHCLSVHPCYTAVHPCGIPQRPSARQSANDRRWAGQVQPQSLLGRQGAPASSHEGASTVRNAVLSVWRATGA